MSLASAQRALAKVNRETMSKTSQGKIAQSIGSDLSEIVQMGAGYIDEKYNVTENVNAWEDYKAGQEYIGIEDPNQPLKSSQKWFKKPGDVYGDTLDARGGVNKSYTAQEVSSVGALSRSDMRAAYEGYMDGDLASKVGKPLSAITVQEGITEPPSEMQKHLFGDDTVKRMSLSQGEEAKKYLSSATLDENKMGGKSILNPYGDAEGLTKVTTSDKRKYTTLEDPRAGDSSLAPVSDNNAFQVGSESGNLKAAKFLREEHGMKGKKLSKMIPGWSSMSETEKLDKLYELGYSPGEESSTLEGKLNKPTSEIAGI